MLYTKDIDYYMDYLQEQDEIVCRKIQGRKPSLFYNIGFITFDKTNNPKCNTMTPRCARGKNIFDMRYIFIPIHHGLHFTCAVIYVGYHTHKITLPVMPLMVPVTLPIPVMSAACTGTVRPFILRFFS
jgi:Ulp1 family protease